MTLKNGDGYRPCVGMLVVNQQGKVWVGHRAVRKSLNGPVDGNAHTAADPFWQMPQGGIDKGEAPQEAAFRELYEEIGVKENAVTLLRESSDWIYYDFPKSMTSKMAQKYHGQKQIWFAFRFTGDESDISIDGSVSGHEAEFDAWKWVDIKTLPDLVVPFKRDVYVKIVAQFSDIAS